MWSLTMIFHPISGSLGTTYNRRVPNCDLRLAHLEKLIESVFSVRPGLLRSPTRGLAHVARARQIAIYLGHVALGLSLSSLARHFDRDRTTISYSCHAIEDARDEQGFDNLLDTLEKQLLSLVELSCVPA
jgi:chromosomal replication initiation ATPase DnaA